MLQHTQLFVKLRFQDSCAGETVTVFLERNAKQDPRTTFYLYCSERQTKTQ